MAERTFTLDEANALLPEVRQLVEAMVEHRSTLIAAAARRAEVQIHINGNGGGIDGQEIGSLDAAGHAAGAGLAEAMEGLAGLGVQVKDVDAGLVDFPAERDGELVLLCWQLGEDEVAWWHGPEDGFAGRRPLPFD